MSSSQAYDLKIRVGGGLIFGHLSILNHFDYFKKLIPVTNAKITEVFFPYPSYFVTKIIVDQLYGLSYDLETVPYDKERWLLPVEIICCKKMMGLPFDLELHALEIDASHRTQIVSILASLDLPNQPIIIDTLRRQLPSDYNRTTFSQAFPHLNPTIADTLYPFVKSYVISNQTITFYSDHAIPVYRHSHQEAPLSVEIYDGCRAYIISPSINSKILTILNLHTGNSTQHIVYDRKYVIIGFTIIYINFDHLYAFDALRMKIKRTFDLATLPPKKYYQPHLGTCKDSNNKTFATIHYGPTYIWNHETGVIKSESFSYFS